MGVQHKAARVGADEFAGGVRQRAEMKRKLPAQVWARIQAGGRGNELAAAPTTLSRGPQFSCLPTPTARCFLGIGEYGGEYGHG